MSPAINFDSWIENTTEQVIDLSDDETTLVINELMAANAGSVMSPAINFDSWIELYNYGDKEINLEGMYLSDDASNLIRWQMPSDMGTIPAKGYKVIWLGSNDIKLGKNLNDVGKYQAPFKLDCDGGSIYLSDQSENLITSLNYPEAMSRTSYARTTDGGDEWGWTADATPGASNASAAFATERLAAPVVNVDSKLFTDALSVSVNIPEGATLMYTTDGRLPEIGIVSPWLDYVKNGNCEGTDASCFGSKKGSGSIVYTITDGIGVNSSRGIQVQASRNTSNSQFFVYTPDHTWQEGERYRFRMKVRADKAATITAYAHKTPGNKISNWGNVQMLNGNYNVTTGWTEISYEGTVSSNQSGSSTLQTIAFTLSNTNSSSIYFYFDDISWELYDNIPQQSEDGQFTLTETTNLTFRLFKEGFLPSVPVTRSYIKTSNNYTLPIISIVGDKRFFTDSKIGFDTDGDGTNGIVAGYTGGAAKNYAQDWDRPVNFSYLSPEGEMLFNQDVNIKASGGYTRSQTYRSFKLKASKVFDGQNRYDYPFFPQKPYIRNKTILVRNGGNDYWESNARFMDAALETIIQRSGIDVDVQSYVPVIEYVNGTLRGVFNMREPNNDDFAYANWGYNDEELDAFENLEMKNGDDDAINRIFDLAKDINASGAYEELKTLLDIDEYTNYMAATLFLYNDDWPDNNIKAYRSHKEDDDNNDVNDGRYRFVSYDLDYAFKRCWTNAKTNDPSVDNPFTNFARFKDDYGPKRNGHPIVYNKEFVNLFLDLLNHDGYRRKFIDTFCLMGGSVFEPTRAATIVDELKDKVKPMCDLMIQQGITDGHYPENSANIIKSNLEGRSQLMAGYMKEFSYMQLSNNPQAVTLKVDTKGARLFINDINVPYSDFDGHLFAPVTLRAEAPAGYSFAGWKQGDEILSTDTEISLPTDATVSLTATFTPIPEINLPPVRINEVSAANSIYVNEYFKRNDWIELYNTTSTPIDVQGMYLTDNIDKPHKYQISAAPYATESTIIPPYGYLVVWCDKLDPESQLHTSFKLGAEDGGDVLLTASDDSWSDRLSYDEHKSDETVGRYPDGGDMVYIMNVPTIGKANMISSYSIIVDQPEPDPIIPGDVNGDGNVDIMDVTCIISHILGNTPNPFIEEAADLNKDNEINIVDVTAVTAIILSSNK